MRFITALAALPLCLSACNGTEPSNNATAEKAAPQPFLLSCKFSEKSEISTDDIKHTPTVAERIEKYRIDEAKQMIERYDTNKRAFEPYCLKGKCTLEVHPRSISYQSDYKDKDGSQHLLGTIDRETGSIKRRYFQADTGTGLVMESTGQGTCEKITDAQLKPKF